MKKLKVIFFGTPEFARACLEKIHHSDHEIAAVVTVPDKTSGRGQKLSQSAVKLYAEQNNLPVFQPDKLRNRQFLEDMRKLKADVFVVVAFRMMPKILFEIPELGTFNLHASLLPDYRGAAPINYAIINGERKTGVTTFFINEKIDEGHILLQAETEIGPDENAGQLHDRLQDLGANLIIETLNGLAEGNLNEKPQKESDYRKDAFKIFKEDTQINWKQPAKKVFDFIRGMSPYPAAFTKLQIGNEQKILKIFAGKFEVKKHLSIPGKSEISKNSFLVYTEDGIYYPEELQLEGKKRIDVKSFLNGFREFENIQIYNAD